MKSKFIKIEPAQKIIIENEEYESGALIVKINRKQYFLVLRKYINYSIDYEKYKQENVYSEKVINDFLKNRLKYGNSNSFIVDMHGIKNFIHAEALDFQDSLIRSILKELEILKTREYLRIGVSGAPKTNIHPGGEVLEDQMLNGVDGSGISNSLSGYLTDENGFSKGIKLALNHTMLEERIVYSHTAFLEKTKKNSNLYFRIPLSPKLNLIGEIRQKAEELGIKAYAAQIFLNNKQGERILIKGRVLKRKPVWKLKNIEEATEIGNEKVFALKKDQIFTSFGTYYDRQDKDWFIFTEGREYEKYGHFHAKISNDVSDNQHEVFHLREINSQSEILAEVIISPVHEIIKISPIKEEEEGQLRCAVTGKALYKLINEFI